MIPIIRISHDRPEPPPRGFLPAMLCLAAAILFAAAAILLFCGASPVPASLAVLLAIFACRSFAEIARRQ